MTMSSPNTTTRTATTRVLPTQIDIEKAQQFMGKVVTAVVVA
jgi:hypothetical protein